MTPKRRYSAQRRSDSIYGSLFLNPTNLKRPPCMPRRNKRRKYESELSLLERIIAELRWRLKYAEYKPERPE